MGNNGYSIQSLEDGITAKEKNIETFETAIKQESVTIKSYQGMIDDIKAGNNNSGFSEDSLKNGILASEKNIKTFEDAIKRERDDIKDYRFMIKTVQRKEREAEITNVVIDASQLRN